MAWHSKKNRDVEQDFDFEHRQLAEISRAIRQGDEVKADQLREQLVETIPEILEAEKREAKQHGQA